MKLIGRGSDCVCFVILALPLDARVSSAGYENAKVTTIIMCYCVSTCTYLKVRLRSVEFFLLCSRLSCGGMFVLGVLLEHIHPHTSVLRAQGSLNQIWFLSAARYVWNGHLFKIVPGCLMSSLRTDWLELLSSNTAWRYCLILPCFFSVFSGQAVCLTLCCYEFVMSFPALENLSIIYLHLSYGSLRTSCVYKPLK